MVLPQAVWRPFCLALGRASVGAAQGNEATIRSNMQGGAAVSKTDNSLERCSCDPLVPTLPLPQALGPAAHWRTAGLADLGGRGRRGVTAGLGGSGKGTARPWLPASWVGRPNSEGL